MQAIMMTLMFLIADPAQDTSRAIQRVLDDQAAAWNKGDLPGFMKGYLESDKLSFFSNSTKTAGWKATLERYQKKYQGEGKEMGKLTFTRANDRNARRRSCPWCTRAAFGYSSKATTRLASSR